MRTLAAVALQFACAAVALAQVRMNVLVYDQAGVPDTTMEKGLAEAQYLLQKAGVQLRMVHCAREPDCVRPTGRTDVVLVFRSSAPDMLPGSALGHTVVAPDRIETTYAFIYAIPVAQLAAETQAAAWLVLGAAVAHELGHVILGPRHSGRGLMRGVWHREDIDLLRRRGLCFDTDEAAGLRAAVATRAREAAGATELAKMGGP